MRKIRWGVLGTADIARGATIPGMQLAKNCELYAVAGRRMEKAQQYQKQFGFQKAYEGYDALLQDPEVEAVYIPLPNSLHAEWSIRAMQAGKHVLCEKPLAPTEAEAVKLFRTAEENHVFLMEAFAYLHNPAVKAIKGELDAGTIGEIRYIDSAFIGGRRPDTDIRLRKETYGGALYDLGCYPISMILWLTGAEPDQIKATAHFSERGVDLETSAILLYEKGITASADCAMVPDIGRLDRLHILGTKGEIHSPIAFNQSGEITYSVTRDGKKETKTVYSESNYQLEVEQLGHCVAGEETPHVSAAFSICCARTMDRILKEIGY